MIYKKQRIHTELTELYMVVYMVVMGITFIGFCIKGMQLMFFGS